MDAKGQDMSNWGILGRPDGFENWNRSSVLRWMELSRRAVEASKKKGKARDHAMRMIDVEKNAIIDKENSNKQEN